MNIDNKLEEISQNFEAQMKELRTKLKEIAEHLEIRIHELEEKINQGVSSITPADKSIPAKKRNIFSYKATKYWGITLLFLGALYLIRNICGFYWNIPLIPLGMVLIGGYLIFESIHRD